MTIQRLLSLYCTERLWSPVHWEGEVGQPLGRYQSNLLVCTKNGNVFPSFLTGAWGLHTIFPDSKPTVPSIQLLLSYIDTQWHEDIQVLTKCTAKEFPHAPTTTYPPQGSLTGVKFSLSCAQVKKKAPKGKLPQLGSHSSEELPQSWDEVSQR